VTRYRLRIQYAHFDHETYDDRGLVSGDDVLKELDAFDWEGQVVAANQLERCSPTIYVETESGVESIWISGYQDPKSPTFVSECAGSLEKRPAFFGLVTKTVCSSAHSQTMSLEGANAAVRALLAGDYDEMIHLVESGQ